MKLFYTFCLSLLMIFNNLIIAQNQEENPNLDQVPQYLLERASAVTEAPLSSIITIGDWDNFSLGTDFAENNMAMNPNQPTWFFTAYNTNGTHHTENGMDWAINNPVFGATMRGDPVVAYDSLGNLFYENMYGSPSILGCKVVKSTTNGASWGTSVTAIAGVDKNWIICDQTSGPYANYVYTTMTNSSAGNFARSTDHGATFTPTFAPVTQTLPGMMVCVGPQGNVQGGAVYVVTNSGSSFSSTYTFYRSNDGGANFSLQSSVQWSNYVGTNVNGRNSVQNMRTRPYPMIAADNSYGPSRGKLYCVYASNTPSGNGNKPDIFCRSSADGGATWSSPVVVNDDMNTQNNHQWHPAIWCDKETGRLYVMWMDTRDTPTSDSACIYASYSDDGGASFVTNQRISNAKMKINCSTCGGGGTPRYQGDYNGVVSNKKVSMIGWTDFRQGTFQSMTAFFPDFALAIDHSTATLYTSLDSVVFQVSVPSVKLYSDTVILTTTISPAPATGSITVNYPSGNSITSFPGSKPVHLILWGNVPPGIYTATFVASGPNNTPSHKRTATITVLAGTNPQASVTLLPDRSTFVGDTIHVPVHVTGWNIKDLNFYVSYDHSVLSQEGIYYDSVHPSMSVTYNSAFNPTTLAVTLSVTGSSGISLLNSRVIDLIFTLSGPGSTDLHLRRAPDIDPVCSILNNTGVPFIQVIYTDDTITSINIPQNTELQNLVIGDTRCYNALQTIAVAGNGTITTILNGSNVTLIAGQNILLLPSTTVDPGGYLLGYIAPDGPYCENQPPSMITSVDNINDRIVEGTYAFCKIYPNPTNGNFFLEFTGGFDKYHAFMEVYGARGEMVLKSKITEGGSYKVSLAGQPVGMYYIRISGSNTVVVKKIILTK